MEGGERVAETRIIDQAYVKRHNTERLLRSLAHCQPVTRTELARITEMSSASVTRIVGALSALGLVKEVSLTGSAGRGRKAINLRTVPEGMFALGCHIGLNSLRLSLVDFSSTTRATAEVPVYPADRTPERLAGIAREQFLRMAVPFPRRIRCAGVSLSGRVDSEGRVVESTAFGWSDADFITPFSEALSLPVVVENDVKACLTWESASRGLLHEGRDAAYLYLGRTGIGFASTVGGRLVRGQSNAAGEIEDICLGMNEKLSAHLMEDSLVARARRIAPSVATMADILEASRMELPWARVLMDDFFSHLDIVLQLIRALLDPHCIILGGDIPDALRENGMLPPEDHWIPGARFEDSCALGAAAIAMEHALDALIEDSAEA